MEEEIHFIAGRLLLQPRRLQLEYRQPTAGRGRRSPPSIGRRIAEAI